MKKQNISARSQKNYSALMSASMLNEQEVKSQILNGASGPWTDHLEALRLYGLDVIKIIRDNNRLQERWNELHEGLNGMKTTVVEMSVSVEQLDDLNNEMKVALKQGKN